MLTLRDPLLIESRRLLLCLDNLEVAARATQARAVLDTLEADSLGWSQQCEAVRATDIEWIHNQDMIEQLHWVLGRNVVADAPEDILLPGALLTSVYAGAVAYFKVRMAASPSEKQIDFKDYDEFRIASKGWLARALILITCPRRPARSEMRCCRCRSKRLK